MNIGGSLVDMDVYHFYSANDLVSDESVSRGACLLDLSDQIELYHWIQFGLVTTNQKGENGNWERRVFYSVCALRSKQSPASRPDKVLLSVQKTMCAEYRTDFIVLDLMTMTVQDWHGKQMNDYFCDPSFDLEKLQEIDPAVSSNGVKLSRRETLILKRNAYYTACKRIYNASRMVPKDWNLSSSQRVEVSPEVLLHRNRKWEPIRGYRPTVSELINDGTE